jgi:hypothetical protein
VQADGVLPGLMRKYEFCLAPASFGMNDKDKSTLPATPENTSEIMLQVNR